MSDVRTIGVIGAGTMGAGIAIVAARAGYHTILCDAQPEALSRSRAQTESFIHKSVQKGKLTQAQADRTLADIVTTTSVDDLYRCELVIEAIFEDLDAKRELFRRLDTVCPPETIFTSNTSTLSITEIAAGSGRPDRFAGMHFCLPAQLMKLVEVSPGINTSEQTFARVWELCEGMGQRPVKTQDSPGFILNYFVVPFNNDAIRLVEQNVASPADIDLAIKVALGHPLGPCELLDMVGLDTQRLLCESFYAATHEPRTACPPLVRRMIAAGRLGRKSGQGFFTYDGNAMFGA